MITQGKVIPIGYPHDEQEAVRKGGIDGFCSKVNRAMIVEIISSGWVHRRPAVFQPFEGDPGNFAFMNDGEELVL